MAGQCSGNLELSDRRLHGATKYVRVCLAAASFFLLAAPAPPATTLQPADWFQIEVLDDQTGRGVPLVELETVHHLRFVTDNAGRVAFYEPGLMGQTLFFYVRSHGYEYPKDGFGYAGVRLETIPGKKAVIKLKRLNIAERLYRITGEGLYHDTMLLGLKAPLDEPLGRGKVAGQDSIQAAVYRGQIYWFWGDTSRLRYPLGNFWMSGATSALPGQGGLDPAVGANLRYFVDAEGFCKPMCRLDKQEGLVWLDGPLVIADASGRERLVGHYARLKSLGKTLAHGLAVFNDEKSEFEKLAELDLQQRWRCPVGQPFRHREGNQDYFYCGPSYANVRVRATWQAVCDPKQYEAFTCLAPEGGSATVKRDAQGQAVYEWRTDSEPITAAAERKLIREGKLQAAEARFQPVDVETDRAVHLHNGSLRWNEFRRRWILIVVQEGGTSYLGEVWYAEAKDPMGPWLRARKIVTHDKYSFYNPVHHPFFDQEDGRVIYFEGTYANTFSGNPDATPRYDYNQIMYRLRLDDPRLAKAHQD